MANPEHLALLKKSVQEWNAWQSEHPESKANLALADLSGMNLHHAILVGANLFGANLSRSNLNTSNLLAANLIGTQLIGTKLSGAYVREASLIRANLTNALLIDADMSGAHLRDAVMRNADLRRARLLNTSFTKAQMEKADLSHADLRDAEFGYAELSDANLSDSDMRGAVLTGANLSRAAMRDADMTNARLDNAKLTLAHLDGATLSRASLVWCDLSKASLRNTIFRQCTVTNTTVDYAVLGNTMFISIDLSQVHGLDTCIHGGPSIIDVQTLGESGALPVQFLRGIGFSDRMLDSLPLLFSDGSQFYSCFISYSTNDEEFATRLHDDLRQNGVPCWFAPHDLHAGRKLHEQIDEAIRMQDKLLLILSPDSMSSEWVRTEIAKARSRETRDGVRVLFPIGLAQFAALRAWECFDPDTGKDTAREIREYFIPDFSNWKDKESYEQAFERLVRDLKAEEKTRIGAP